MYTARNGWTKARMIKRIMKRNNGTGAIDTKTRDCVHQTEDGNHCAIGCFIPKTAKNAMQARGSVVTLLKHFPRIKKYMPLTLKGLVELQRLHDESRIFGELDVRERMIIWVKRNVRDAK